MAFRFLNLSLTALILSATSFAFGFEADDEDGMAAMAEDKAQVRSYPGARDEQELQVQASLPTPSRTLEGFSVLSETSPNSGVRAPTDSD